jgi:ATP-binding cassette subfamily B protein
MLVYGRTNRAGSWKINMKRLKMHSSAKTHSQTMWRILKISWQARPLAFCLFFVGAAVEIASSILTLYATAKLSALLAHFITTGNTDMIWFWLWVDIACAAFIGLGFWIMEYAKRLLYYDLSAWSIRVFIQAICSIDIHDFYNEESRNQINKAQSGYTWQIPNTSWIGLELVYSVVRFLAFAFVVAQISIWLIFILALFLVPTLISENKIAKLQWFVWDEKGDQRHVFWQLEWLIRQPKKQMELRSSQARKYVNDKINRMNRIFYSRQEQEYKRLMPLSLSAKTLEVGGTAIGSVIVLKQFLNHTISLDKYFFLSGALLRIGGSLNAIFGTLSRLQEPMLFAQNFFAVIDKQPRITDQPNAIRLAKNHVPEIVFEDVSFTYPEQKSPIFTNLNLTIRPGEHTAIVGENGAGKTTLIKLLMRFYIPTNGRILIDGHDLQSIAIESWYAQLATLFQEFNNYPFPIDENIYIGDPEAKNDKQRLNRAAGFGGVDKLVDSFEHGWETVLDSSFEKGTEPSGGQWQRVALARAFFRDANVLILDEPTAAIDAKAEYEIFNNIFEHYQDRTTLIVSHRFSTVRRADRIVVVDKGKIVEEGSHKDLMKIKGLYHEMFTKQAEGYKD